jgi:putative FmdB family regulatory protein
LSHLVRRRDDPHRVAARITGVKNGDHVAHIGGADASAWPRWRPKREAAGPGVIEGRQRMPIYEYQCRSCEHRFERLVRPSSRPAADVLACPSCRSEDLQRLTSLFAVSSDGTRQAHLNQARKLGEKQSLEKQHADVDDMTHHDH